MRACGDGVVDLEVRQVVGARHAVVHVGRRDQLSGIVVMRVLEKRLTDTLGNAAVNLAFDDHRVDQVPEIVTAGPVDKLDNAGCRVDFDFGDVVPDG